MKEQNLFFLMIKYRKKNKNHKPLNEILTMISLILWMNIRKLGNKIKDIFELFEQKIFLVEQITN